MVASDGYRPNNSHPSPGIAMLAQGMNRRVRGVPNKQRGTPPSLLFDWSGSWPGARRAEPD
ncbi:hypothetical protein GCM10023322_59270 [Rugosimonospora acidiphila]|uniref:Uncharacterized protein n=1 Tax=Rugosimonospora acidiphila TaxID=556531 RepID=A0ABP9SDK6_9ACTN